MTEDADMNHANSNAGGDAEKTAMPPRLAYSLTLEHALTLGVVGHPQLAAALLFISNIYHNDREKFDELNKELMRTSIKVVPPKIDTRTPATAMHPAARTEAISVISCILDTPDYFDHPRYAHLHPDDKENMRRALFDRLGELETAHELYVEGLLAAAEQKVQEENHWPEVLNEQGAAE